MQEQSSRRTQIFQAVLGITFLGFGILHLIAPPFIEENMTALGIEWMLPIVAIVEILGGLALFAGLRISGLSGLAALWVSATMAGAIIAHLRVGDFAGSFAPLTFLIPALVLVYLRRADWLRFLPVKQTT